VSKLGGWDAQGKGSDAKRASNEPETLTSDAEIEEVFQKLRQVAAKQGFSTWSPALTGDLLSPELNKVVGITAKLKELKAAAAKGGEKLELWKELKVETFAQCVAVVWGISVLNSFLSVQLMIIARISTLFKLHAPPNSELQYNDVRTLLEKELEKVIDRFMKKTLRDICSISTESAAKALDSVDLKRMMSFGDVLSTLACISSTTEFRISGKGWARTLLSAKKDGEDSDTTCSKSEAELRDQYHSNLRRVLEGQDFEFAVSVSARSVSDMLMNRCKDLFIMQTEQRSGAKRTRESEGARALPLAKVVPLVSTSTEQIIADCNPIIEYEVSKLPEVIRACADAFSVHVA